MSASYRWQSTFFFRTNLDLTSVESARVAFETSPADRASGLWLAFASPHMHSPKLALCMFTTYLWRRSMKGISCAKATAEKCGRMLAVQR